MSDERRVHDLVDRLLAEFPPADTPPREFLGAQFDSGLAWIHFPEGNGGLGLSPWYQRIVNVRIGAAGGPMCSTYNPIGYGMCGPTVAAWGSDAQRQAYLRPLFTCEEVWCQLFSEPGAGSDFAGLAASGVEADVQWVCNGQKVWTTLAHVARRGLLVVRTDPGVVKHAGLTAFVLDMQTPGVEVLPLRQMTGEAEFNEVFLTDVRVPAAEMLGKPGDGWRVSLTTLMNERMSIGGAVPPRGSGPIADLVDVWKGLPDGDRSVVQRDRVTALWARAEVLRLTNVRASHSRGAGEPGPEGSIGKAMSADLNKDIYNAAIDLLGAAGTLFTTYAMVRPDTSLVTFDSMQKAFLRMRAMSIEGGTSEIMRNILGERVLGLPGDVRVDRDRPWSEVPRS